MAQAGGAAHSPLEQFEIDTIIPLSVGGVDLSFTNSSLFMLIALVLASAFLVFGMRRRSLVPGRWQVATELSYEFVAGLIRDTIGSEGRRFFPFVLTVFMFVLFGNLLGMVPYSFTLTSHIVVTFALAIIIFIGVTILGFVSHGLHFLTFFVPPGSPLLLLPLLIPLEILSSLSPARKTRGSGTGVHTVSLPVVRPSLLPRRADGVHVRAVRQPARHGPVQLHPHQPHRRHLRAGDHHFYRRHHPGLRQARAALPDLLRSTGIAASAVAAADPDRDHLLPVASDQPVGAAFRQHAGGTYPAEGDRRIHRRAGRRRRSAAGARREIGGESWRGRVCRYG